VNVTANTADSLWLLGLALGAASSAGVAGGVNVMVFQSKTSALLGGAVTASTGKISVLAGSDSVLVNIAAAIGVGGSAGVTGIALVTYFYNSTIARVTDHARLIAQGDITVKATSEEIVSADGAGVAGGGTAGVGGTLDVVVMLLNTQAYTGNFVSLTSTAGSVTVAAADRYELITVVVTAAIGGTAGVGISVLASVSFNTVEAKIGASNTVNAYNSVIVQASSNRNIVSVVASVAGGGVAGVGLSVSVVVAGAAMSQDAHDGIYAEKSQLIYSDGSKSYYVYTDAGGALLFQDSSKQLYSFSGAYLDGNGNLVVPSDSGRNSASANGDMTAVMGSSGGINPQTQLDAGFSSGNQTALSGQKPADSLDTLLSGDGQAMKDQGQGYGEYGQDLYQHPHSAQDGYTVYQDADGNYVYEKDGTYYRLTDGSYAAVSDVTSSDLTAMYDSQKYVLYTQTNGTYTGVSTADTATDSDQFVQHTQDGYTVYRDSNGSYVYQKDGAYFRLTGDSYTKDSSVNSSSLTALYRRQRSDKSDSTSSDNMNDSTIDDANSQSGYQSEKIGSYKDAVSAVIDVSSKVTAQTGDISVVASDVINANMVAGTISIGGTAGVGVGLSVSVLSSNVVAEVGDGASLEATNGNIHVLASSGAGIAEIPTAGTYSGKGNAAIYDKAAKDMQASNEKANSDLSSSDAKETGEHSAIRLISVTAGGGLVGVNVSAAVLVTTATAKAVMNGSVTKADSLIVESRMDYGEVLTVTIAAGGGAVAVGVSAGATYFEGTAVAGIGGSGTISNVAVVTVKTSGETSASVRRAGPLAAARWRSMPGWRWRLTKLQQKPLSADASPSMRRK